MDFINNVDYKQWKMNPDWRWCGDEKGWYDVEWEFIKGRIESEEIQNFLIDAADNKKHIVTVAVCLPKSHQSIAAAMYLPESVFANCLQVLAYQRRSGTIINYLAGKDLNDNIKLRYKKILPFGMLEQGYDSSLDDDYRAMLISYVYDSYFAVKEACKDTYKKTDKETGKKVDTQTRTLSTISWDESDVAFLRFDSKDGFRDYATNEERKEGVLFREYTHYQHAWQRKPVMDKLSCIFNASTIDTKLRGIKWKDKSGNMEFSPEELAILKRVEHNRWNIEKMLTGFRALSVDEMEEMTSLKVKDYQAWKRKRGEYKEWPFRAHIDICSVEELIRREDAGTIEFDSSLSKAIPYIIAKEKKKKEEELRKKK
jgi:hypothetical protein